MERRRRERNKRGLATPCDGDAHYLKFPNERLGNDYKLNWEFVRLGLPPQGTNAFRNLHDRHLAMYCNGTADKFNAIHVSNAEEGPIAHYIAQGAYEPAVSPAGSQTLNTEQWTLLMHRVTKHLSESETLFMQDGALGSHRSVETRVKVLTNDALTALFMKNTLVSTPGQASAFGASVFLYHAPDIQIKQPAMYGLKDAGPAVVHFVMKGSEALKTLEKQKSQSFTDEFKDSDVADCLVSFVVVIGVKSLSSVLEPLTNAANFFALRERVLPLHASTVLSADGQKSTLVFNNASFVSDLCAPANLFASGRTVAGEQGLYKAFRGLSHTQEALDRKLGDIVEKVGGKTLCHTQLLNADLVAPLPAHAVFLVADKSAAPVSKVDAEAAAKLFTSSLSASPRLEPQAGLNTAGFQSFLQTSNPQIFVINTSGQTDAHVRDLIGRIAEGDTNLSAKPSAPSQSTPPQDSSSTAPNAAKEQKTTANKSKKVNQAAKNKE